MDGVIVDLIQQGGLGVCCLILFYLLRRANAERREHYRSMERVTVELLHQIDSARKEGRTQIPLDVVRRALVPESKAEHGDQR